MQATATFPMSGRKGGEREGGPTTGTGPKTPATKVNRQQLEMTANSIDLVVEAIEAGNRQVFGLDPDEALRNIAQELRNWARRGSSEA